MCEFVSWVETHELDKQGKTKIFFLTGKQIFETEKGKKLQEWAKSSEDLVGHGAIRFYYGLEQDKGTNQECTDFSFPDNFPIGIVKAIKRGDMMEFAMPRGLLLKPLYDKYWADRKPLDDKYLADLKSLYDKYLADLKPLDDKYWAERKLLDDRYWS